MFPICLFAGLHIGEACQLRVDDVEVEHSVHALQVRPDPDAGVRLKTKHSRRTVPIHEELIPCGLLEHVEKIRPFPALGEPVPGEVQRQG
jgi:integrase